MARLNGVNVDATDRNLKEYLLEQGFLLEKIAVEKNGDIIPKSKMEHDMIQENDQIEVVTFVGGG
jgi:sulfur carrier protein